MASSGSFSFQPWECWHFPDCLLILGIMQSAVVISRNYTSVLSFNTSLVVPNFVGEFCLHCNELLSTLRYNKEPVLPLAKNSLGIYLPRHVVCHVPVCPSCMSHCEEIQSWEMKTSLWRQPQQQLRCCWCQLSCALALLQ